MTTTTAEPKSVDSLIADVSDAMNADRAKAEQQWREIVFAVADGKTLKDERLLRKLFADLGRGPDDLARDAKLVQQRRAWRKLVDAHDDLQQAWEEARAQKDIITRDCNSQICVLQQRIADADWHARETLSQLYKSNDAARDLEFTASAEIRGAIFDVEQELAATHGRLAKHKKQIDTWKRDDAVRIERLRRKSKFFLDAPKSEPDLADVEAFRATECETRIVELESKLAELKRQSLEV